MQCCYHEWQEHVPAFCPNSCHMHLVNYFLQIDHNKYSIKSSLYHLFYIQVDELLSRQVKMVLDETFSASTASYLYSICDSYHKDCFIFPIWFGSF